MIAMPYDYFLIAWFGLALASTAYVAFDQFNGKPRTDCDEAGLHPGGLMLDLDVH
jgi:hypothetical protein